MIAIEGPSMSGGNGIGVRSEWSIATANHWVQSEATPTRYARSSSAAGMSSCAVASARSIACCGWALPSLRRPPMMSKIAEMLP
jgi:hypothetical protein